MLANIFEISLSEHAKKINETFYLKPFRGKPQTKINLYSLPVERISHGAQHAARTAIYVRVLVNFFRAKGYQEALDLTEEDVFLLQITALMHDVSRFDDRSVDTTENESAQNCYFYFKEHGISEERSRYFSNLIVQKEDGNFLGKILQSCDCLDIMRCKKIFYVDLLSILTILQAEHRGFLFTLIDEIAQFIANQYDMKEDVVVSFQGKEITKYQKTRDPSRPELKGDYEHSENCYLRTYEEIDYYLLLSKYFHNNSLLKLSNSESEIDSMNDSNDITGKRKREIEAQRNNIETVDHDVDVQRFADELENQLLQTETESHEPVLKKAKIKSAAYTHGYETGLSRIERTSASLKTINVPKKYVTEQDRKDFRLGYKEGDEFMNKNLAEDKPVFYALGIDEGEKHALNYYRLNGVSSCPYASPKASFKSIYQFRTQTKLKSFYQQGFSLGYHYCGNLLDNYYQNYIKAYDAVIKSKLPEIVITKSPEEEKFTPSQLERIKLQAIAGHKDGIEFASSVIANKAHKNHLAFFKLQIQRLIKLHEAGNINWFRQQSFIAKLHPKAWENRGYILRNYFHPNRVEYSSGPVRYFYTCKEEAISHFIFFQLLLPYKFQLELDHESFKIILQHADHKELRDLRSVDSLAKSVRWDEKIFFGDFLLSITKSPSNQPQENLRKGPHKKYTVFGHGFFLRNQKISPYNLLPKKLERKKLKTSLHQSTSLITGDQPIFGHHRRNKLVGYMFKPSKLINRIYYQDMGTVNRPYEFDDLRDAETYFNQKVKSSTPTMFKTLKELKQRIIFDTKSYNEVLARLKWDINTSCIAIFSDTFEARCIAQFYAKLTYRRLTCQYREIGLELPQDYQIPIVFYLPEKGLDNWQIYSAEQQANDKITAESIAANHENILEALNKHNVEFLLLLDNLGDLTFLRFPVIFWVAYSSSLNIAEVLYEQTNEFFLKSFKDYLKDLLLNAWRLETNRLHASMRVVYLRMALELGLMDLIKEIITVKLVDEDNSTHYGHFLFRLIEGKEFQLLTEILTSQKVDLEKANPMGETLLHLAAKINHLELVKLLIEKGASTMVKDKNGQTPLVVCIQKGIDNSEMIELILQHSSKDSKDIHLELHALERACVFLNKPVLETLLKFGLIKGSMNTVLLNYVMSSLVKNNFDRESRLQIVRMLLQSGANPTHVHREKSALQRAREQGLEDILREMENHTIQLVLRSPLTKST